MQSQGFASNDENTGNHLVFVVCLYDFVLSLSEETEIV